MLKNLFIVKNIKMSFPFFLYVFPLYITIVLIEQISEKI